jgi:ATP-dependent DNA helicase RecG
MNPIEAQLSRGESKELVFVSTAQDTDRIAAHVVALLNSGGGTILLGVDPKGEVLGIPSAARVKKQLAEELRERVSPKALFSVVNDTVGDREVITIEVPGGRDTPFVCEGSVFLRKGKNTVAAAAEDLQRLLQEKEPETERWERRGSPVLEPKDLDTAEIRKTVQAAQTAGRFTFRDADDTEAVLLDLGMRQRGLLTNAADVCFGKSPAQRHPQMHLRAYALQSDKSGEYIDEADFNGPISQMIEEARAFILRNSSLAAQFLPASMERKNIKPYPDAAIREGLVNALAHRDYGNFSGGVSVLVYPDRVEIWNSGRLPKGWKADRLRHNHPSLPANPDVAHYLYIRRLMERVGRGTLKIIESCREANLPAPTWKADDDGVTLTLHSYASRTAPVSSLSDRQQKLIDALKPGQSIRLREYLERFASGVTDRQARRDLKDLESADIFRLEGKGRSAHYVRTDRTWQP